jgi:aldehyde dehydrogenase (NAD+)
VNDYALYIDGKFSDAASGDTYDSINPSNGLVVAHAAKASRKDARKAVEAARRAFDDADWSARTPEARRDALLGVCDSLWERQAEIADLEARDAGMTIRMATATIAAAIMQSRELVKLATSIPLVESLPHNEFPAPSQNLLVREPYGVCTAISPFNSPFAIAAWKVFPALAMGNTVVLKPSPYTPCTAMELARAFATSDVPPGAMNVLTGGGSDVGEELVENPFVDRVAFTGSTEVGRRIMQLASHSITRVTLELGGKSANVLLDDADLDAAIPAAMWAVFLQSGQTCQAGTRLFVPESIADEVTDRIVSAATQLRLGPATSWETDLGPLISQAQIDRVERFVKLGREEGASLACGGYRTGDEGFYFAPTVFANVRNDMRIAQEEIFGPVLSVIPYRTVDEAVAGANASIYGLAGAVWSRDVPRALAVARRLRAGTVWVNEYHLIYSAGPYGGYKQSGLGKELGVAGCLEYAQSKHVWVDQSRAIEKRFWPPLLGLDRVFGIEYK